MPKQEMKADDLFEVTVDYNVRRQLDASDAAVLMRAPIVFRGMDRAGRYAVNKLFLKFLDDVADLSRFEPIDNFDQLKKQIEADK